MRSTLDHIVLNVSNIESMLAFYTEVMQFEPERLDEYRAGTAPFPSVRLNETTIIDLFAGDETAPEGRCRNLDHFCIALTKSDWDALRQRLQAHAITLDGEPGTRWGARGNAIAISFPDPEGNTIEARYYP